jgi:uncharacterized protein (TIGR04255 family)
MAAKGKRVRAASAPKDLRLRNPPIVEAVIEIRREVPAAWDRAQITAHLRERLPDYPTVTDHNRFAFSASFHVGKDGPAAAPSEAVAHDAGWQGVQLTNKEGTYTAKFLRDLFSMSRLKPYESWGAFWEEAWRLWQVYLRCTEPSNVARLGLRYINRLDPPGADADPRKYLRGVTLVRKGLRIGGFFHEEVLAAEPPFAVTLRRAGQPKAGARGMTLLLDIDVMTTDSPRAPDADEIRQRFARMRALRTEVFLSSCTEAALELIR